MASKKIEYCISFELQKYIYKKNYIKYFLYYLLNIFSLKNSKTKNKKYENSNIEILIFNSSYNGMWQSIPQEGYERLQKKVNLIIKFSVIRKN